MPLALIVSLFAGGSFHVTRAGVTLALASGIVASGLGYVVWYAALRGLSRTHAATVQLSAPVIAAFGGIVFLAEPLTLRLAITSLALLGAIAVIVPRPAITASGAVTSPGTRGLPSSRTE